MMMDDVIGLIVHLATIMLKVLVSFPCGIVGFFVGFAAQGFRAGIHAADRADEELV